MEVQKDISGSRIFWIARIALFINYFWFGILKFFPGVSPAEKLAGETIHELTVGFLEQSYSVVILAVVEVSLALGLLMRKTLLWSLRLILIHMIFTFSTFLFYPDLLIGEEMFSLTLAGQYVIKNLVFIALVVILIQQIKSRNA